MLRHIISASLAMVACATLIPTKVNAVTLTATPASTLTSPRNPGDTVEFTLYFDPDPFSIVVLETLNVTFDETEFSNWFPVISFATNSIHTDKKKSIASFKGIVSKPVKDGVPDFRAELSYSIFGSSGAPFNAKADGADVTPVPEPLTMLGAATALGYGVILKRKSSKKTVS